MSAVFAVDSLDFGTIAFAMLNAKVASGEKPGNERQGVTTLGVSEHVNRISLRYGSLFFVALTDKLMGWFGFFSPSGLT